MAELAPHSDDNCPHIDHEIESDAQVVQLRAGIERVIKLAEQHGHASTVNIASKLRELL